MLNRHHRYKKTLGVLSRTFLVIAVLTSYGGGSALLQSFAWLTMLPEKIALSGSIEGGITQTFNGENPCSLCELAKNIREKEKPNPDPERKTQKIETKEKTPFSERTHLKFSASHSLVLLKKEPICPIIKHPKIVESPPPDRV